MPLAVDLLNPDPEKERRKHKLKRLVPHPNSFVSNFYSQKPKNLKKTESKTNQKIKIVLNSSFSSSWTSNARAATKSPPCSRMPRPLWYELNQKLVKIQIFHRFASAAALCCAPQRAEKRDWWRAAHSGRRATEWEANWSATIVEGGMKSNIFKNHHSFKF